MDFSIVKSDSSIEFTSCRLWTLVKFKMLFTLFQTQLTHIETVGAYDMFVSNIFRRLYEFKILDLSCS